MRREPPTIRLPLRPPVHSIAELALLLGSEQRVLEKLVLDAPRSYGRIVIPKSSGGFREISPPNEILRATQRRVLELFRPCVHYPRWMIGGVPGCSIFDHAKIHVGRKMVATLDVQAFYPSTNATMVREVLHQLGVQAQALEAVLELVVKDNQLPQGAPTSGLLANLVLENADRRIDGICRRHGFNFTRYVDDIAISGGVDLRGFKGAFIQPIEDCGYRIVPEKIHFMGREVVQIVTKLCVNDKLRPTREFIADVKESIWLCLRIGAGAAAMVEGVSLIRLKNRLTGKVGHIAQADPKIGKKLSGMLCDVDWSQKTPTHTPSLTQSSGPFTGVAYDGDFVFFR